MRKALKFILNLLSQLLILPLVILCKLEEIVFSKNAELIFHTCTHIVAMLPGLPGAFLRRAFYSLTLDECSLHCHVGFGTIFSHRSTTVEKHVYIGSYSIIGSAHLGEHCLIGSRVSILSGKALHVLGEDGMWTPYSAELLSQVKIHKNVWVGEGAIVAANIGEGCMIGAGSVITTDVKPHIIITGNPARFVRNLEIDESTTKTS